LQLLEYANYFAEAGYNPTGLHLALNRPAVNLGRCAILAVIGCFPPKCAFRERERLTDAAFYRRAINEQAAPISLPDSRPSRNQRS
jgi:hypothetical protein